MPSMVLSQAVGPCSSMPRPAMIPGAPATRFLAREQLARGGRVLLTREIRRTSPAPPRALSGGEDDAGPDQW